MVNKHKRTGSVCTIIQNRAWKPNKRSIKYMKKFCKSLKFLNITFWVNEIPSPNHHYVHRQSSATCNNSYAVSFIYNIEFCICDSGQFACCFSQNSFSSVHELIAQQIRIANEKWINKTTTNTQPINQYAHGSNNAYDHCSILSTMCVLYAQWFLHQNEK